MSIKDKDGRIAWICTITDNYTSADAAAVGAVEGEVYSNLNRALLYSFREDFDKYVDAGLANDNILAAHKDCHINPPHNFDSAALPEDPYEDMTPSAVQAIDLFGENRLWGLMVLEAVKLNPHPTDPTNQPYASPVMDIAYCLASNLTWPAAWDANGRAVVTGDAAGLDIYVGAKIKQDADTQANPYFKVVAVSGTDITIKRTENRSLPTAGAAASSILLTGSGTTIGIAGTGLPTLFQGGFPFPGFSNPWAVSPFTGLPVTQIIHPETRLWSAANPTLGAPGAAHPAGDNPKLGGFIGTDIFFFGFSSPYEYLGWTSITGFVWADGDRKEMAATVTWPAPVTGPDEAVISVSDASEIILDNNSAPVQAIKLDDDPVEFNYFKILGVDGTDVTVSVPAGKTTPDQTSYATSKTSLVMQGRLRGIAPHAKVVNYQLLITGPSYQAVASQTLGYLNRVESDGVEALYVGSSAAAGLIPETAQDLRHAFSQVSVPIFSLTSDGTVFGQDYDIWSGGGHNLVPDGSLNIFNVQACGPKDFNFNDPQLGDYVPAYSPQPRPKRRNLCRPVLALAPRFTNTIGTYSPMGTSANFGATVDCCLPFGSVDERYPYTWDDNMTYTCSVRRNFVNPPAVPFGSTVLPPDMGYHGMLGGAGAAPWGCGVAAIFSEAYRRKNGSAPTANKLSQILRKSCRKGLGPKEDDHIFLFPLFRRGNSTPYPKTSTQRVLDTGDIIETFDRGGETITWSNVVPNAQALPGFSPLKGVHDTNFKWGLNRKAVGRGVMSLKKGVNYICGVSDSSDSNINSDS